MSPQSWRMQVSLLDSAPVHFGAQLGSAPVAALLVHGRGQSAMDMIHVADRLDLPNVSYLALTTVHAAWYPQSFMAPIQDNQPHLDLALEQIEHQVRKLEVVGFTRRRIALIGFSQGACLASEYVRRRPTRWAGLIAFTGGLPGPDGCGWDGAPDLDGTPVLLSNSDADPWVPWSRVEESAAEFRRMGAAVVVKLCRGRDHIVSDPEIFAARSLLREPCAGFHPTGPQIPGADGTAGEGLRPSGGRS